MSSSDEDVEMANADRDNEVKNIVKLFLNNAANQYPIKRPQIIQQALNGKAKSFTTQFNAAKNILSQIYGLQVFEVDSKVKQYIVVSEFTASPKEFTKQQRTQQVLLMIILSYIYMKGSAIPERNLFVFLRTLNIDVEGDDEHPYFGDNLKKLITEVFVKKLYLKKTKEDDNSSKEPSNLYSWGFRADVEYPKKDVLNEVCKLIKKDPRLFVFQYNQAYQVSDHDMNSTQT